MFFIGECEHMNTNVYNMTKKNVAKALGVNNFIEIVKANEEQRDLIISSAQKRLKLKCNIKLRNLSSGNPYIMLGRKVNSKGKLVK